MWESILSNREMMCVHLPGFLLDPHCPPCHQPHPWSGHVYCSLSEMYLWNTHRQVHEPSHGSLQKRNLTSTWKKKTWNITNFIKVGCTITLEQTLACSIVLAPCPSVLMNTPFIEITTPNVSCSKMFSHTLFVNLFHLRSILGLLCMYFKYRESIPTLSCVSVSF